MTLQADRPGSGLPSTGTGPEADVDGRADEPVVAPPGATTRSDRGHQVDAPYPAPRASINPDRSKTWLQRMMPIVVSHRRPFLVAVVLSLVGLILQIQIPNLLKDGLDNSIVGRTVGLHVYVWWIVALGLGGGIAGYVSRRLLFTTAYDIEYDLRVIIYEHLTRMSFPFYDRVQSGQLISRANSDIRSVQMYITFAPLILVQCAGALVAFAYMLAIDVPLALVAMVTMPFVYLVSARMRKLMFPVSWLIQARLADVATIVDENVNGVRVVKSFAAEPQQLRALAAAADRVQWGYIKDADLRARWSPALQNLPPLGLALVLLTGGWMVIHGHLGVGSIVAFSSWLLMLQAPFLMLGMIIMMGQRASASAARIYEILDEEPTVVEQPGAGELSECRGEVDFDHVDFRYGDEQSPLVLSGFDLHLEPGETAALVGATGSGKSTVARLLARFYDVSAGSVRIDGRDVRALTLHSVRDNVGIVFDEPFLFSVSIGENIAYGRPGASEAEIRAAARAAGAEEFILELPQGYDTVVGERGYTLSGGQRQRVAIARTLLVNPPVLVLDDATSAVDVQVEQEIHEALRTLMTGRTTLVIAHRLSTISLVDRVVLVDGGTVVAQGTHAELLATSPLYAAVLAQGEADDDAATVESERTVG